MAKQIGIKSQTSPTLTSGGLFYQSFGEFEKVTQAMMTNDLTVPQGGAQVSGYSLFATPAIVSGNVVRVQVNKYANAVSGATILLSGFVSLVAGSGVVAVSGDVVGNTFTVLAAGE